MSITGILIAAACVGIVGIFVGLFLGVAGIKFKVEVDEKEEAVLAALPAVSSTMGIPLKDSGTSLSAAVGSPDVPDLPLRLQKERLPLIPVR